MSTYEIFYYITKILNKHAEYTQNDFSSPVVQMSCLLNLYATTYVNIHACLVQAHFACQE